MYNKNNLKFWKGTDNFVMTILREKIVNKQREDVKEWKNNLYFFFYLPACLAMLASYRK